MVTTTQYNWRTVAKAITSKSSPDLFYLKKMYGFYINELAQIQHDKKQLGKLGKPKNNEEILQRKNESDWLQERETIALEDLKWAERNLANELRYSDAFDMDKYSPAEVKQGE